MTHRITRYVPICLKLLCIQEPGDLCAVEGFGAGHGRIHKLYVDHVHLSGIKCRDVFRISATTKKGIRGKSGQKLNLISKFGNFKTLIVFII